MATAGTDFAVMNPKLYWAPRGSTIPPINVNYGAVWPAPWVKINDTVSGLELTQRAPREGVFSEERQRIGSVPAAPGGGGGRRGGGGGGGGRRGGGGGGGRGTAGQGAGTAVGFQALTFTSDFWRLANKFSTIIVPAQAEVITMTFLTAATSNGNLTITLDNVPTNVPVTSATQTTATLVATAVRSATFAGWTTGGTGATVTFTATTPGLKANPTFAGGGTGVTIGATDPTITTMGHAGFNSNYVDRIKEYNWMIGFDGFVKAGSIFAVDTLLRGICFRVENTQDGTDVWGYDGRDAVVDANVILEALPEDFATYPNMFTGTGITSLQVDPYQRFALLDMTFH